MDTEVLALKWNNHQSIFYHIICGLRTKGSYTDVTLACEGKFYPVHKLVLSTCSEYFSEIFDRTPCKNPVVVLKDIQCKDLEFLLDYMYIGEVNVRQNELSSLIKAAECLKVKGLAVQEDEPKQLSSGNKQRLGDHDRVTRNTPPPKRRRAEERRNSIPQTYDSFSDRYVKDSRLNESTQSKDASVPTIASEQTEPLGDQQLDNDQDEQDQSRDTDCEQVVAAPLTEIKVEQDLVYEDNGNFDSSKASAPSSFDGDHYSEEPRSPKTEPEEASVMDEGVMGVNFNDLLQSSLTNDDSVDPHPSVHPHMNMDPSWDSGTVGRGLPSHGLPAAVGSLNTLSHHQQQKAAVAALGLLHSSGSDSQSSLRLLQQQQQQQGAANDLFNQQQNVMVGEGALMADYLQKKDKGLRDYVCQYCSREFGHRTNLQAHLRIHTGEKPFRCLYCPYRTALKGNLKMHTISRHKVDWKSIKHLVHPDDNAS